MFSTPACGECQLVKRLENLLPVVKPKSIGAVVQELLQSKRATGRRERYIKSLRQYLSLFIKGREHLPIDSFNAAQIEFWFDQRNKAPSTRASNLGRLSALFSFAVRRGYVRANPCDCVERITVEKNPPMILTVEQCKKLFTYASLRWMPYLALSLFAGIRPEELSRLTWGDVDFEKGTIAVSAAASKVHRRRIVHLPPNCIAWLRLGGGRLPVPAQARRRLLYKMRFALGLDRWPQDCLRHTAASMMLARDGSAERVALELGNSPKILMRHYHELVTADDAQKFFDIQPGKI